MNAMRTPDLAADVTRPRTQRRWRRRLAYLVCVYLVLLLLIPIGCTDRLILFPTTEPLGVEGIGRREVPMPAGGTIELWTGRSPGAVDREPRAFVLAFIGNAARAEWTAQYFARDWGGKPIEVWAVNYPGFGGSTGKARLKSIPPAALAAFDALRQHAGDRPILVEGRSIGTTAALYVAAHRPVAGCVLHNPPPLRQLIVGRFGWWNLWLVAGPVSWSVPTELDSLSNAANVHVPAVFALAGADEVVPPEYQLRVLDAYVGQKTAVHVPNANHNNRIGGSALVEFEAAIDRLWNTIVPD